MTNLKILQRVELLFNQSRYEEARKTLEAHLSTHPTDFFARRYYVIALSNSGEMDLARERCDALLADYPEDDDILYLSIQIDLADEYYNKAESKVQILKEKGILNEDTFFLEARTKMGQRNYDKALEAVNLALEKDANHVESLNLKVAIEGLLKKNDPQKSIEHALALDPENPYTIANHAYQLLREKKVDAALERAAEALEKDPNNPLARQVMAQAMRSRFWLFRLFFQYSEFVATLTAKGSWALIIGIYIVYRIFISLSENYPTLLPIVYLFFGLFILTWLVTPLSNLYLYFNKYGRLLLDKDDTKMALSVGAALSIAIVGLVGYFTTDQGISLNIAMIAGLSAIPLSSYLNPTKKKNQEKLKVITFLIISIGVASILFDAGGLMGIFFLGIFAYQWVVNGMLIKEGARVID